MNGRRASELGRISVKVRTMTFPGPTRFTADMSVKLPEGLNTALLTLLMELHKTTAVCKGMTARRLAMIHKDTAEATTSQTLVVTASLNPAVMVNQNLAAMVTPATTMALLGTTVASDMLWDDITLKS